MPATLKSRLPEIAESLRPEVSKVVKEGAELVAATAKLNAPVDTGALKAAIHVERRGAAEYAVVAGGGDAWYGHIVEHGSAVGGRGRPPLPPRPFLVPALEVHRLVIQKMIEAAIDG